MADPVSPKSPLKGKQMTLQVNLLDDTVQTFQVPAKAMGHILWELVVKYLELLEADYFDLEYIDEHRLQCWLDREKPILKQLRSAENQLQFCVKFYTPDPGLLEEEYTRYLFALQIKQDLRSGTMPCNENTVALLASYVVQAELGDFLEEEYVDPTYLSSCKFVPHQPPDLERKIMEYHRQHLGQSPSEADLNLLDTARKVELYGIKMFPAKDHEGVHLNLAVAHMGIVVFQNLTKINTFSWAKIRKLSFKRKKFLIKLHAENYGYYKDIVEFFFDSRNECKGFWKKCIEHHAFFRCHEVKKIPRNKTRVVSRGSSYRYSGRTQKQLMEYVRENFKKRPFERTISGRISNRSRSATPKIHTKTSTLNSSDFHVSQNSTASSGSQILENAQDNHLASTRVETAEVHSESSMSGSRSLGSPKLEAAHSHDAEATTEEGMMAAGASQQGESSEHVNRGAKSNLNGIHLRVRSDRQQQALSANQNANDNDEKALRTSGSYDCEEVLHDKSSESEDMVTQIFKSVSFTEDTVHTKHTDDDDYVFSYDAVAIGGDDLNLGDSRCSGPIQNKNKFVNGDTDSFQVDGQVCLKELDETNRVNVGSDNDTYKNESSLPVEEVISNSNKLGDCHILVENVCDAVEKLDEVKMIEMESLTPEKFVKQAVITEEVGDEVKFEQTEVVAANGKKWVGNQVLVKDTENQFVGNVAFEMTNERSVVMVLNEEVKESQKIIDRMDVSKVVANFEEQVDESQMVFDVAEQVNERKQKIVDVRACTKVLDNQVTDLDKQVDSGAVIEIENSSDTFMIQKSDTEKIASISASLELMVDEIVAEVLSESQFLDGIEKNVMETRLEILVDEFSGFDGSGSGDKIEKINKDIICDQDAARAIKVFVNNNGVEETEEGKDVVDDVKAKTILEGRGKDEEQHEHASGLNECPRGMKNKGSRDLLKNGDEKPFENEQNDEVTSKNTQNRSELDEVINTKLHKLKKPINLMNGTDLITDIPYILHRRLIEADQEQKAETEVYAITPSDHQSFVNSENSTMSLSSNLLGDELSLTSDSQSPRSVQCRSPNQKSSMSLTPNDRSPATPRRVEFVNYHKLPPKDSYSCVDDTTSPSLEKEILQQIRKRYEEGEQTINDTNQLGDNLQENFYSILSDVQKPKAISCQVEKWRPEEVREESVIRTVQSSVSNSEESCKINNSAVSVPADIDRSTAEEELQMKLESALQDPATMAALILSQDGTAEERKVTFSTFKPSLPSVCVADDEFTLSENIYEDHPPLVTVKQDTLVSPSMPLATITEEDNSVECLKTAPEENGQKISGTFRRRSAHSDPSTPKRLSIHEDADDSSVTDSQVGEENFDVQDLLEPLELLAIDNDSEDGFNGSYASTNRDSVSERSFDPNLRRPQDKLDVVSNIQQNASSASSLESLEDEDEKRKKRYSIDPLEVLEKIESIVSSDDEDISVTNCHQEDIPKFVVTAGSNLDKLFKNPIQRSFEDLENSDCGSVSDSEGSADLDEEKHMELNVEIPPPLPAKMVANANAKESAYKRYCDSSSDTTDFQETDSSTILSSPDSSQLSPLTPEVNKISLSEATAEQRTSSVYQNPYAETVLRRELNYAPTAQ